MKTLTEVLEKSIKRNGEQPITNVWLLNMLRLVRRNLDGYEKFLDGIQDTIDLDGQGG